MLGLLLPLAMTTGVQAAMPAPTRVAIEISVFAGDPLGTPESGAIKTLARPTVLTQPGRPAAVRVGGPGRFDYTIEVLPILLADGTLYLEAGIDEWAKTARAGDPANDRVRYALLRAAGKPLTARIAAESPASQTWAVIRAVPAFEPAR